MAASLKGGRQRQSPIPTEAEAVVHVLWINAGPELRRRFGRPDGGDAAEHRRDRAGRSARPSEGRGALAADRFRMRPGGRRRHLHQLVLQGRARRDRPVRAGRRRLDPQRIDQGGGLLGRLRHRPCDRASRSPPASGSTASLPRPWPCWRWAPAPPTAASTPWPATRPAPWACPTIWVGIGSRRPASRSSACPVVRSSRTTSPRPFFTCSTRPPARRR